MKALPRGSYKATPLMTGKHRVLSCGYTENVHSHDLWAFVLANVPSFGSGVGEERLYVRQWPARHGQDV